MSRCARLSCPCPSSWDGQATSFCCKTCFQGTACSVATHFAPTSNNPNNNNSTAATASSSSSSSSSPAPLTNQELALCDEIETRWSGFFIGLFLLELFVLCDALSWMNPRKFYANNQHVFLKLTQVLEYLDKGLTHGQNTKPNTTLTQMKGKRIALLTSVGFNAVLFFFLFFTSLFWFLAFVTLVVVALYVKGLPMVIKFHQELLAQGPGVFAFPVQGWTSPIPSAVDSIFGPKFKTQ